MEELHTDSIDGGHEASYGLGHVPGRGRTPTTMLSHELLLFREAGFAGRERFPDSG
jgi:hypothetical protein